MDVWWNNRFLCKDLRCTDITYFSSSFSAQNAAANSPGLLAFIFADDDSYANLKDLPATKDPEFFERKIVVVWGKQGKKARPQKGKDRLPSMIFQGRTVSFGEGALPKFTGWWFRVYFYFHPDPWGHDPIWGTYFSNGLVQPPTSDLLGEGI